MLQKHFGILRQLTNWEDWTAHIHTTSFFQHALVGLVFQSSAATFSHVTMRCTAFYDTRLRYLFMKDVSFVGEGLSV